MGPFKVGDNARIAANSVVLKEVPANSTVVGVPGRVVKINGEKVADMNMMIKAADLPEKELLLQTGKKNFKKVLFN